MLTKMTIPSRYRQAIVIKPHGNKTFARGYLLASSRYSCHLEIVSYGASDVENLSTEYG